MNCLEFRHEKLADPRRLSAEALAHLEQCALCDAFARSVDESEARLAEMLRVPVPDGLAERAILRRKNGFPLTRRRRDSRAIPRGGTRHSRPVRRENTQRSYLLL